MWREANDGGICKDGDEDLRLEKSICSRDSEWLNQTSQTPGQGVEDLIKDHLACAVILQDTKPTCNTETPNDLAYCTPEAGLSVSCFPQSMTFIPAQFRQRFYIELNACSLHASMKPLWEPRSTSKNVKLELKSVTSGADSTSGALCTEALLCRLKSRSDGFSPHWE